MTPSRGRPIVPGDGGGPALGPADAPVTVIEFGCYTCPYTRLSAAAVDELLGRHGDSVRFVYRHFPLDAAETVRSACEVERAGPYAGATRAAVAAGCARAQDRFWEYHRLLLSRPDAVVTCDGLVLLAREAAGRFLGARRSEEIVFTQNTTYAINLVAQSFPFHAGDVVVTSDQEHNSNLLPWQQLARHGVRHRVVPFGDAEALARALTPEVKLVSMVMTSNLDGTSIDTRRVIEVTHARGVPVLLDAAQAVPHQAIDVRALDVDFLACSGHKMLGPSATGILYGKQAWLGRLCLTLVGGGTVEDSTLEPASYRDGPERFEAGLQNYAGIVGLRHAIEYLEAIGRDTVREHDRALTRQLDEGLRRYEDITIYGPPPDRRAGITSFSFRGIDVHDVCLLLDESANIAVRSGRHCVHSWFNAHGIDGTVRVSFYLYNTAEEVSAFLDALHNVHRVLA